MESLPQIHLILVIVFTDEIEVDRSHWRTWLPFAVSVVSAAYGMTKFFSIGPCRLLPYDRMGVGFFLVIINIIAYLIGKTWILASAITVFERKLEYAYIIAVWISVSLLPQTIFVSYDIQLGTFWVDLHCM